MPDDMSEAEQIALLFKQGGIEVITEAKDSFAHLTEEMKETAKAADQVQEATKSVDTTTQEAIEVLKSDSTVVDDLKQKIAELTAQQNALRDSFIAGLIPSASQFKEKFDALGDSITDKQGILDRAVGEGGDDDGTSGFKGIAGAAVKAEKAIGKLASGHGLNSLPGLLESVAGAVGLGGGAGLAAGGLILAFESIIPKVEAFIEKVTGAAAAAKKAAEEMKEAHAQMAKFMGEPTAEEEGTAKAVKEAIKGKQKFIAQGVEQSLITEGYGGIDPEKMSRLRTFLGHGKALDELEEENRQQIAQASAHRRTEIMKDLLAGKQGAISDVEGMTIRHEGLFPAGTEQHLRQALPENIGAAKEQAQKAAADSEWADTSYAKREAARKESEAIDVEFDKARKDKKQHAAADYDAAMKFAANMKADLDRKAIAAEKHEATQAEHNVRAAKTAADKARRAQEKWDREHTPDYLTQQEAKAEAGAIMGAEREQNQYRADMGAMPFDSRELEQVKHKALQAMPYYKARGFSLGQLVADMMAMQANEIEQGMSEGLDHHGRSGQNVNPKGGH